MRTFVKPLTAAAGVGILALTMTAAPAMAAPAADPNGNSPSVTVHSEADKAFTTGVAVKIREGEDLAVRPKEQWSCGLLRLDGYVGSTPSKDNRYKAGWRVAVGASYQLPNLTITMPKSSSKGLGWKIPDQTPKFGDDKTYVDDLPATNTHPEYRYIDKNRVEVEEKHDEVLIKVNGGLEAGEYFNVEFDSELTEKPVVGSEYINELKTDTNCYMPEPPKESSSVGGKTAEEECYEGRTPDGKECDGRDEKCEEGMSKGPNGEWCDKKGKHPVKVNSGGENDSTSGLLALALGAAVIGGAATYGLRRHKKS